MALRRLLCLLGRSEVISSSKLFVGNLSYQTTKAQLVEALSPAGEITDAYLPVDRESGRPRGFGFVTFATPEMAKAAMEQFEGKDLNGRELRLKEAEDRRGPRPTGGRPPGSSGGRPGGPPRSGGGGRPGGGRPPRGAMPPPEEPTVDPFDPRGYDGSADEEDDLPHWKKKKKTRKGSRRGLRAKKRSL